MGHHFLGTSSRRVSENSSAWYAAGSWIKKFPGIGIVRVEWTAACDDDQLSTRIGKNLHGCSIRKQYMYSYQMRISLESRYSEWILTTLILVPSSTYSFYGIL
jgi:hypothetical protein